MEYSNKYSFNAKIKKVRSKSQRCNCVFFCYCLCSLYFLPCGLSLVWISISADGKDIRAVNVNCCDVMFAVFLLDSFGYFLIFSLTSDLHLHISDDSQKQKKNKNKKQSLSKKQKTTTWESTHKQYKRGVGRKKPLNPRTAAEHVVNLLKTQWGFEISFSQRSRSTELYSNAVQQANIWVDACFMFVKLIWSERLQKWLWGWLSRERFEH